MTKKVNLINYSSRDFDSIKKDLVEYAKRYYPDTFQDFSQASFGALMLDTVSYVGDILSFYVDYQANETFIDSAIEYNNIARLGKQMGFRFRGNPSSYGIATFFIAVPANTNGIGVNEDYIPILKKGSKIASGAGNNFILAEDVNFNKEGIETIVASVDETTSIPLTYAMKAHGQVLSGEINRTIIVVGNYEPFLKVNVPGNNITEILEVVDSEGNTYTEVDYLSQDVVYQSVGNSNQDQDSVPYVLTPRAVPRRFTTTQEATSTNIQFGYGSEEELTMETIRDPSAVVLKRHAKDYVTDESFDPSNLLSSDKFGVVPSNTKLTVTYRSNSRANVNAAARSLKTVTSPLLEFPAGLSGKVLSAETLSTITDSLEVDNDEPILGSVSLNTPEELRHMVKDTFATQNRAVTKEDYINLVYRMPRQFGAIKRCNLMQDANSFKRNLNMYILAEAPAGNLIQANSTLKRNLKAWLEKYKMINDTIDLLDAVVINFGVEYELITLEEENKLDVLNSSLNSLQEFLSKKIFNIGTPLSIAEIYSFLNRLPGVADVTNVIINKKTGAKYSEAFFSIDSHTTPDGRLIVLPENAIFELKYPSLDIKGTVK